MVAVDALSGDVLMPAYVNRATLAATLASGWATYWSRSQNSGKLVIDAGHTSRSRGARWLSRAWAYQASGGTSPTQVLR